MDALMMIVLLGFALFVVLPLVQLVLALALWVLMLVGWLAGLAGAALMDLSALVRPVAKAAR